MKSMLNIAEEIALKAGKLINQHIDRLDNIRIASKGYNDYITEVDKGAENIIISALKEAFPEHGIISEESKPEGQSNEYCWIIDPIDGTTNFIHGYPQFAVSIACQRNKETVIGVVYNPCNHELFTAIRGSGAYLNNKRIRVSSTRLVSQSLIGTGFPFRNPEKIDSYTNVFKEVLKTTSGIRRAGAAALDLAYVACGRLDGFWEQGLQIWDMAAGCLLIEEAGGFVTDFDNKCHFLKKQELIAGNKYAHKALQTIVKKHLTDN